MSFEQTPSTFVAISPLRFQYLGLSSKGILTLIYVPFNAPKQFCSYNNNKMQSAIYSIFLLHNLKRKFTLLDTLNHFHLSFEEFFGTGSGFLNSSPCKRMIACNTSLKYLLTVSPKRLKWCFITRFFA